MKERIKQIRLNLGMNQGEFAHAANIVQQQLSKYERGENKPSSEFLTVLVDKFRVNINWLLTGKGEIFTVKSSKKGNNAVEIFFIEENDIENKTKSMYFDENLIKDVWHKNPDNLKLAVMPDSSMHDNSDFRAEKDDILLVDTSFTEFDFGVFLYKANGRLFVNSFTPLIDGGFLAGKDKNNNVIYTKETIKNAETVIIGKVLKNLSYISR